MAKLYKHQDEVEQRMFAYDINSLKQRSEEYLLTRQITLVIISRKKKK